MNKKLFLFILIFFSFLVAKADTLKGYVYDSAENPIIGAHLSWENRSTGVVTNDVGYFEIQGNPETNHMLVVSYIGYSNKVVHIHSYREIQRIILEESNELSEVVITKSAPGRISSRVETLNTEKVSSRELTRAACCSLAESFETNPSVDVSYSDAVTGAKQIQLLGLSGNYVEMLTENYPNFRGGAKLYGLDYIPGPWMESIQISKGAASVKNGYESISGQINVEYKKPKTADPLSLNLFMSDSRRIEGNADAAIQVNDKLSTGIFAHYANEKKEHDENGDGFLDTPKRHQLNFMNRWHYRSDRFISQSGVKFINDERISGQTMHTMPKDVAYDPYLITNYTNRGEVFSKNGFILNPDKNESIALIVAGSYHDQKLKYALDTYNLYETNGYASILYEKDLSSVHKLSTGLSINWDKFTQTVDITRLNMAKQPDHETTPGAYIQYTFNATDKITVLAGLRADHSSVYDWFITPRLHFKYDIASWVHLRLSAGKGYRSVFVLPENSYIFASSRAINIADNLKQESAWNYGASSSFYIPINGEELTLSGEYYYTDFSRQVVMDMDSDPHAVSFYNLKGKSHAHVLQVEASYPIFRGFNLLASYRWMDTKIDYNGKMMRKPLTSRYKAMATASYETPLRKWQFDFTTQFNGSGRMPTPDQTNPLWGKTFKSYVLMNAQVTKYFRTWSVYMGAENIGDYTQKDPIIAAKDPYGSDFDGTMVWGPTMGRKFYIGMRFNLSK